MSNSSDNKPKIKEFFLSSWAIENRVTVFLITILLVIVGAFTYMTLPKENFPEIIIPTMMIATPYPGTSPEDIEQLVTRKIEKEVKSIKGVKKLTSQSIQDFSMVVVEFETNVDLKEAKRQVQEAVDKSKSDLPTDLPNDPNVQDINLSEFPIMFLNLYGDLDLVTLKRYAEDLKDEIEALPEINRIDIVGALDREIQVNVDVYKMAAAGVGFGDIQSAIARENVIISGGEISVGGMRRSLRIHGEFETVSEIGEVIVTGPKGNRSYLKDIATVKDGFRERESYARLDGKTVITLNVVKKSGENLVIASDKIKSIVREMEENKFPANLNVNISADQSYQTKNMLNELSNTIIIGFILVTIVLMFFMGLRDAMFVGLSVPLSCLIAFIVLPFLGFTLNLVVLFTFIFALGIVVDNAIVVIENTYRILNEEGLPVRLAAKKAAGEVIGPVFAGTLTTMAPFIPLAFWEGIIGEFMFFLPITIMITLFASLLVAYVINPVFAATFMSPEADRKPLKAKGYFVFAGVILLFAAIAYLSIGIVAGNIFIWFLILFSLSRWALGPMIKSFQKNVIPWMMDSYRNLLRWALRGSNPWIVMAGLFGLLVFSIVLINFNPPKTVFFPEPEPNFVYIYNEMPIGTDIEVTDSVTRLIEARVKEVIGEDNPIIKSVISNVAVGAGDPNQDFSKNSIPHKSKVGLEFVPYKERNGMSTAKILNDIRAQIKNIPGTKITVEKEASGPPTAKPINIEIAGENFEEIIQTAKGMKLYLEDLGIPGVEELKWDIQLNKPELVINIDRVKARELGTSTAQIGVAIRTAVFGKEVSKFRVNEDEYPIQIRLDEKYRDDISSILNQHLVYMNMADQKIYELPISAVASIEYESTVGGIKRLDMQKVITIYSNVLSNYNMNEVVAEVVKKMDEYKLSHPEIPRDVTIEMTGQMEEQMDTAIFMGKALAAAIMLIILILVSQFNSMSKLGIILFQIILSMIGVFLGFALTGMEFSIAMSGIGIVSLAGIVVNNGILLLDFIETMKKRGFRSRDALIEAGRVRFTPVILTASSTVIGLLPLALSMNINFGTLLSDFNPHLFFGGDTAVFWGPLSWTVIFGLSFATMITLIAVPVMYHLSYVSGIVMWRWYNRNIRHSSLFN